jgi:hypothetical protein
MHEKIIDAYEVAFQPAPNESVLVGVFVEGVGEEFERGVWCFQGSDLILRGKTEVWRYVGFVGQPQEALLQAGVLHVLDLDADKISFCTKSA